MSQVTQLVNEYLDLDTFPDRLKLANITSLFKNGDTECATNYRPVSKTHALAKTFEKNLQH